MTDVSVIIVNHNTRDLLMACLDSLYQHGGVSPLEVILIDNASTDGSLEAVHQRFPSVTVLSNIANEGFAKPNNQGMELARGRFLFLLNSDTVLEEDALRILVTALERNPAAGACGPMLVHPDGSIQHSVRGFPTLLTHLADMLFLDRLFPRIPAFGSAEMATFDYSEGAEVDHVMAAAFLLRREVLSQVGGFDDRFSIYYNDMDWCVRIRQRGWKILYVPEARIMHHGGATTSLINKDFSYFRELHENVEFYYRKHFGALSVVFYRMFLALGFVLRTLGWGAVRLLRPTDRSRHMFAFSWRTLLHALGLRFPARAPRRDVNPAAYGERGSS